MIAAAFTGWQLGAGSGKTLDEYLASVGLAEKEKKLTQEQRDYETKMAIEKAERIKAMDKRRGKK